MGVFLLDHVTLSIKGLTFRTIMTDNTSTAKLQFRKRKKKKKNIISPLALSKSLQSPTNNNDTDIPPQQEEEEDDDLSFLHKLKETKTIKNIQFKSKSKGLVFEENNAFTSSGLENPNTFKHDLSRDFDQSFSTEKVQDDKLKTQREEWVEEELRKRLLKKGRVLPQNKEKKESESECKQTVTTLKEQLYALSDKLEAPLLSQRDHDEAGERWLAGMAEYELPLEYKLKNIKQTEDAKKKLLEPKAKSDKMFAIPRNYNGDFTTHHFERVKIAEHKRKLEEEQQKLSMQRERKKRRLMGSQWYNNK